MSFTKLHITELNEFLITAIINNNGPVEAEIKDVTVDGFISIEVIKSDKPFNNYFIDFDLQSCECSGLNEHDDISEYHGKTVHTSSAYEFVEFISAFSGKSKLLVNVEEGSWVISLLNFS